REAQQAAGIFKVAFHEAANITGSGSEIVGCAGMTHGVEREGSVCFQGFLPCVWVKVKGSAEQDARFFDRGMRS
ncbi:MAG: hypothetical protein CMP29_04170, partial [Roseibacillus sp.]|nr:hypothetical protein [Roseibacillus sp.]